MARRTALLIGNGAYESAPLKNPGSDAQLVASTLARLGCEVTVHRDLAKEAMMRTVREWLADAASAELRFFFFAGHGYQYRGENYLLPIDARLTQPDDVLAIGLNATSVAERLSRWPSGVNVVVLDACRDAPFPMPGRKSRGEARSVGPAGGMAPAVPAKGTIIGFSTAPGALALDGSGANSPYSKHLAAQLLQPGVPLEVIFKRVRQAVAQETGNRQVPWEASSLVGDYCMVEGASQVCPAGVPTRSIDLGKLGR